MPSGAVLLELQYHVRRDSCPLWLLCNTARSQDRQADGKAAGNLTKFKALDLHAPLWASYGRAQDAVACLNGFLRPSQSAATKLRTQLVIIQQHDEQILQHKASRYHCKCFTLVDPKSC